jgi:hypothetical protein
MVPLDNREFGYEKAGKAKGTQLFPAYNKKLCPITFWSLNFKPRQRMAAPRSLNPSGMQWT